MLRLVDVEDQLVRVDRSGGPSVGLEQGQPLDNEATVLRALGDGGGKGTRTESWADAAVEQAELLRKLAQRHAPRDGD